MCTGWWYAYSSDCLPNDSERFWTAAPARMEYSKLDALCWTIASTMLAHRMRFLSVFTPMHHINLKKRGQDQMSMKERQSKVCCREIARARDSAPRVGWCEFGNGVTRIEWNELNELRCEIWIEGRELCDMSWETWLVWNELSSDQLCVMSWNDWYEMNCACDCLGGNWVSWGLWDELCEMSWVRWVM